MKRLLILTACAALLLSGCRNCSWFKRNRGAPCRSSLTFNPYTAAPAPMAPGCGLDAYAGEMVCGQDVVVGYGGAEVNGGFVGAEYYDETQPPVAIESSPVSPPVGGNGP